MCERHEILLHRIDPEIIETTRGRHRWLYLIDCDGLPTSASSLDSEAAARGEALASARSRIEVATHAPPAFAIAEASHARSRAAAL